MPTILLLIVSNTFMTLAWYGHLKHRSSPLVSAILVSWLIALGEYCFQVPANRLGYGAFTGYPTQDHPRGHHSGRFCGFCLRLLRGAAQMELRRCFGVPHRRL